MTDPTTTRAEAQARLDALYADLRSDPDYAVRPQSERIARARRAAGDAEHFMGCGAFHAAAIRATVGRALVGGI